MYARNFVYDREPMRRPLLAALAATCAAALISHAWLGNYVRYEGDDFCFAGMLVEHGFWGAQVHWYTMWFGRFAFTFVATALDLLGANVVRVVPAVLVAVWSAIAIRSVRSAAGLAVVYATIAGSPEVYQSALWETGIVTYAVPVVLMTLWCGAWLRRSDDAIHPIDIVVPLLAGGFSETAAICNVVFFGLGMLMSRGRRPFVAATLSALVSFTIVAVAPGNMVRLAVQPPHATPILAAIPATYTDLGSEILHGGAQLLLVFAAAALLLPRRANRRAVVFALLVVVLCPYICEVASFATVGKSLPERALIVTHFFTVVAMAVCGASLDRRPLFTALAALALIAPIVTTVENIQAVPRERLIAWRLDRLDAELRAGATLVHAPDAIHGNLMISADPTTWENYCVCKYYRLRSVRAFGPIIR